MVGRLIFFVVPVVLIVVEHANQEVQIALQLGFLPLNDKIQHLPLRLLHGVQLLVNAEQGHRHEQHGRVAHKRGQMGLVLDGIGSVGQRSPQEVWAVHKLSQVGSGRNRDLVIAAHRLPAADDLLNSRCNGLHSRPQCGQFG